MTGVQTCALPICKIPPPFMLTHAWFFVMTVIFVSVISLCCSQVHFSTTNLPEAEGWVMNEFTDYENEEGLVHFANMKRKRSEERRVGNECRSRW